jgi:hypothetical protein
MQLCVVRCKGCMEENHIACNCEIFNDEEVWANHAAILG